MEINYYKGKSCTVEFTSDIMPWDRRKASLWAKRRYIQINRF